MRISRGDNTVLVVVVVGVVGGRFRAVAKELAGLGRPLNPPATPRACIFGILGDRRDAGRGGAVVEMVEGWYSSCIPIGAVCGRAGTAR